MRLVSCVGLLMVIPSIALLTRSSMPMVNKPATAQANQLDKTRSVTHQQTIKADSVQLTNISNVQPAQNHSDFSVSSVAKPGLRK